MSCLDTQPNIPYLQGRLLAHGEIDEVRRVFIQNVNMMKSRQKYLLADGGGYGEEERHGGR